MRKKHKHLLQSIFTDPIQADILWCDVETMLKALGAKITERKGSRICVSLNGVKAIFHRPHPQKETDKGAVKSVRRFLTETGVNHDEL
jgi:hypothetical protein